MVLETLTRKSSEDAEIPAVVDPLDSIDFLDDDGTNLTARPMTVGVVGNVSFSDLWKISQGNPQGLIKSFETQLS